MFARDEYRLGGLAPRSLDTVVDIGAHAGFFAIRAAAVARRILCYEPAPENFELLRLNVSPYPDVKPFPCGVTGRGEPMTLYLHEMFARHSMFPSGDLSACGSVKVPTTTLAGIFAEHSIERCDLLKMDCEGAEYDIAYGAPSDIWRRIERTRIEYHPSTGGDPRWTGKGLASFLERAGHRVQRLPNRRNPGQGLLFSSR
jgi:FkbM family methyltransferase